MAKGSESESKENYKVPFFIDVSLCSGFATQKLASGVKKKAAGSPGAGGGWNLIVESHSEVSGLSTAENLKTYSFLCLSKSNVLLQIKKMHASRH